MFSIADSFSITKAPKINLMERLIHFPRVIQVSPSIKPGDYKISKLLPPIKSNHSIYELTSHDYIPEMCRIHVPFSDSQFGYKSHCKIRTFKNTRIKIPTPPGYRLLTPDVYLTKKGLIVHDYVYLIKEENLYEIITDPRSAEVVICPCIIDSSQEGHGGIIILGTENEVSTLITEAKLNYKHKINYLRKICDDTCKILVSIRVSDLVEMIEMNTNFLFGETERIEGEEIPINAVLKSITKNFLCDVNPDLHILVGIFENCIKEVDISHGKRRMFESSKECAIRELNEEFTLDCSPEDLTTGPFLCCTHFFVWNL